MSALSKKANPTKSPDLTIVSQPQEFFHQLVAETCRALKVAVLPETEFYLVNLLNQFMTTENLYSRGADGSVREEPLAFLLKDAIEERSPEGKRLMFRHVGDVSLYTAGFFQDSLNRKLVDVDYYIELGGAAYLQAASLTVESSIRPVLSELSSRFPVFVDVLADVSVKTAAPKEQDLVRAYELWTQTQSVRAEKILEKAGIIPPSKKKTDLQ